MSDRKRLPESELDIMLVVWKHGGAITAPAILAGLERPLTASALHSYLKRLEEKGFLSCAKDGKVNAYTALIPQEEYRKTAGKSLLEKLYGGSLARFAASLYDGEPVGREELAELQTLLDELREGAER